MNIHMILACDEKNGIGKNNTLPWNIKKDMSFFKQQTSTTADLGKLNAVVMWRNTWESIPSKFRPLENRINCILTKSIQQNDVHSKTDDFVLYFNSLGTCILELQQKENIEDIYIIGGASIYNELLTTNIIDSIYITRVEWEYDCDRFFNWVPDNFERTYKSEQQTEWEYSFCFEIYKKIS